MFSVCVSEEQYCRHTKCECIQCKLTSFKVRIQSRSWIQCANNPKEIQCLRFGGIAVHFGNCNETQVAWAVIKTGRLTFTSGFTSRPLPISLTYTCGGTIQNVSLTAAVVCLWANCIGIKWYCSIDRAAQVSAENGCKVKWYYDCEQIS